MEKVKTSTLVSKQLPEFVRSDYPKFVTFLEKYYEWLEQANNVSYGVEALSNSNDIDYADDYYISLLKKELLPYFPQEIVADKRLFLKLVTQFYKSSGTPNSVKFLFRALYNDNIEIYYPKDDILIASDGKWVLPLALRIDTDDSNILNISGTLITGQNSKATAVVEKVIQSVDRQLGISYIEVYVSNVKRLFETGETVEASYVDEDTNLTVTVTGRLVGALSEIKINPSFRGLYYKGYDPVNNYDGDPVSIAGGLNPTSSNPIGALAYVGTTTSGGITDITVVNGGFGFRDPADFANSSIIDFSGGFENQALGTEASAKISLLDENTSRLINISNMSISTLDGLGSNTNLTGLVSISSTSNVVSGTGTSFTTELTVGDAVYFGSYLAEVIAIDSALKLNVNTAFATTASGLSIKKAGRTISRIRSNTINTISTFTTFNVYPISFVTVEGSGGGYYGKPTVDVYSFYNEDIEDSVIFENCIISKNTNFVSNNLVNLTSSLDSGDYVRLYKKNVFEEIREISTVTSTTLTFSQNFQNDINGVTVYKLNRNDLYKLGSLGRITINTGGSGYANGDILIFTGGSGYGANGYVNVNASGGIVSVTINNHSANAYVRGGEGYRRDSLPLITVQSAAGINANLSASEIMGDGEQLALTTSKIGAITSLRVISYGYDYVQAPSVSLRNADLLTTGITSGQLFVSNTEVYQGTSNSNFTFKATVDSYNSSGLLRVFDYKGTLDTTKLLKYDSISTVNAVCATVVSSTFYGDGSARATAKFENGLIRLPGIYLNTDGQLSADKRLQDVEKYHNFSYILKTQNDYNKFKDVLNDLAHPLGTKTFVLRTVDSTEEISKTNSTYFITVTDLADTYNIGNGSNSIISTNISANVEALVNVGDYILLSNVHRRLQNTVNVVSGSNVLFGDANSVNFINDLQEGETIYLSTGNTVTIKSITNSNVAILNTTINVTSTTATVNLVYIETGTVLSRNLTTIITGTSFRANNNYLTATVHKVR